MKKQKLGAALLAAAAGMTFAMIGHAQSVDALLDKLVDKGVLTVKEASELREESDKDFTKAYSAKTGLPEWVTSLKFNGDLRLRYDRITAEDTAFEPRNRFRYRLRFGYTAILKDDWEVGIGLTSTEQTGKDSSAADPISNNQSFGDNASKKAIGLDKAYVKWTPVNDATWTFNSTIGKFDNPFVFPSTILFDKDYTPEGIALEAAFRPNDKHTLRALGAAFILDEIAVDTDDPYLFGGQLRWEAAWSPKWQSALGGALLSILNEQTLTNGAIPNVGGGNTRVGPTGVLANSFTSIYADANLTYTFEHAPLYNAPFPITVGADYIHNLDADDDNTGYSFGVVIGKAGKKRLWEINYRYTDFQADAWFEEFVESDFGANYKYNTVNAGGSGYRSGTNVRGHWIKGTYNFYDSLSFSVAYFITDLIHNPPGVAYDSGAGRLFVEAVWKY
jgi:hypothetical protein